MSDASMDTTVLEATLQLLSSWGGLVLLAVVLYRFYLRKEAQMEMQHAEHMAERKETEIAHRAEREASEERMKQTMDQFRQSVDRSLAANTAALQGMTDIMKQVFAKRGNGI